MSILQKNRELPTELRHYQISNFEVLIRQLRINKTNSRPFFKSHDYDQKQLPVKLLIKKLGFASV